MPSAGIQSALALSGRPWRSNRIAISSKAESGSRLKAARALSDKPAEAEEGRPMCKIILFADTNE